MRKFSPLASGKSTAANCPVRRSAFFFLDIGAYRLHRPLIRLNKSRQCAARRKNQSKQKNGFAVFSKTVPFMRVMANKDSR